MPKINAHNNPIFEPEYLFFIIEFQYRWLIILMVICICDVNLLNRNKLAIVIIVNKIVNFVK